MPHQIVLPPALITFEAVAHIDWELRYYWTKGVSRSFFYFAIITRILGRHLKARLINLCEGHALSSQFFLVKSASSDQAIRFNRTILSIFLLIMSLIVRRQDFLLNSAVIAYW
uniref:Uncharacterized protein n=1 Tax=Phlegmariurus squarrosus TaxID=73615 RepID=H9M822_PHLSQ|nr:hypothetical protein HusqMp11 [Phlegmariurus squarrosus]AEV55729.1 hypothetical protein HusqMp11 [Phlegmariurus squarrosus]